MRFANLLFAIAFCTALFAQSADIDPRYHTYDEILTELAQHAVAHPEIILIDTLAFSSVDGLPIVAAKISDNAHEYEREGCVFFVAGQHGNEPAGTEACMWLINWLLDSYDTDTRVRKWIDSLEIWIVPVDNPDGRQIVMNDGPYHSLMWRKTKTDNNGNGVFDPDSDGVDPNRNYSFLWEEYDSFDLTSVNYKGLAPFSTNEARLVADFVAFYRPAVVIDLHSPDSTGGNKLWFSWYDEVRRRFHSECALHYQQVALALANATETETTGTYYLQRSAVNDRPKLQNHVYWHTGTCSILMEITNRCFWSGDTVDTVAARVGRGLTYLFDRMFTSSLIVDAYDSVSGAPVRASVIVNSVTDTTFPPRYCGFNGRYQRFFAPTAGPYTVRVRHHEQEVIFENVTFSDTAVTKLTVPFALDAVTETRTVHNPNDALKFSAGVLRYEGEGGELSIFDISGRAVLAKKIGTGGENLNAQLGTGVYLVRLCDGGKVFTKKILVQN